MSSYISVIAKIAGRREDVLAIERMAREAEAEANIPAEEFKCEVKQETDDCLHIVLRSSLTRYHPTLAYVVSRESLEFANLLGKVGIQRTTIFECDCAESYVLLNGERLEDTEEERNTQYDEGEVIPPSTADIAFKRYCKEIGLPELR